MSFSGVSQVLYVFPGVSPVLYSQSISNRVLQSFCAASAMLIKSTVLAALLACNTDFKRGYLSKRSFPSSHLFVINTSGCCMYDTSPD